MKLVIVALVLLSALPANAAIAPRFSFRFETIVAEKIVKAGRKISGVPDGFIVVSDLKRKLNFLYPSKWPKKVTSDSADEWSAEFVTRFGQEGTSGQVVVRVSKTTYTQETYNNFIKTTLASYGPKKEGEDYSLTFEKFAGATNVLHLKSTNTKDTPAYGDTYAVVKNGNIYVIAYQSTDTHYSGDLSLFSQMLKNFKVK